ncbi:DoxX family protein [Mycolicibacterium llatzerense]|uniref:DoxX family protein n=1 Tax=Mycolicibacterium llatzerense TaxID=280871 RepID=UPI0013A6FFCD|nr:DoxX family protein [Mycolicibacterium llatzerense]
MFALEMAAIGAPKVLQISAVRDSAEHLGVSVDLDRMIGISQLAAAVGLLLGIAFPTLSVVTSAAVCLLMCGAVRYHIKAQDKIVAMVPAVVTAAVAVAIFVLAADIASTTNL